MRRGKIITTPREDMQSHRQPGLWLKDIDGYHSAPLDFPIGQYTAHIPEQHCLIGILLFLTELLQPGDLHLTGLILSFLFYETEATVQPSESSLNVPNVDYITRRCEQCSAGRIDEQQGSRYPV